MDAKVKPIPAFYCCYLLRSSVRHASLYIGSSPHPARRLAQHNGQVKGGAVRTSRLSLRPWEMTCVVAGFPSNIAALQFEWAWQNAHLTRHILADERISFPVTLTKTNSRTGKTRKKPGRPRTSLVERLSNLHLLLRTKYFSQWPLELRFFSEDVYRSWQSWCSRIDTQLRSDLPIVLDLAQAQSGMDDFSSAQRPARIRKADLIGKGGVEGVDPTYARYRDAFEQENFLLDEDDEHKCDVCKSRIDIKTDLFSICIATGCQSMSHITCLSDSFLRAAGSAQLLPTRGCCPGCGTEHAWSDLMRVTTLRLRGEKEIKKVLKKKRSPAATTAAEIMEEDDSADDSDIDDVAGGAQSLHSADDGVFDLHDDLESDADDNMSIVSNVSMRSLTSDTGSPRGRATALQRLEIVIEDSEDER